MHKESNGQVCHPLHVDNLPEYFYQKAEKELNETPKIREEELTKLKDLLSADILTTSIEFEDDFLHQFLRHRKYDSSRAFQYLQKYLNFRRSHSSMFESIPDEDFEGNPATECFSVLPSRCPEGCVIIICQIRKWNPNSLSLEYFKREFMSSFLQTLRYPLTQISGFKIIYDFKDSEKYMRYCTPQNIYLIYNAALNCVPCRYKEVHIINKSIFMVAVWAIMKHLLPEKIRERIIFHPNPEDLLNHFPKSLIPTEYGGSVNKYHDAELMKKLNKEHGNCPEGGQPNYV